MKKIRKHILFLTSLLIFLLTGISVHADERVLTLPSEVTVIEEEAFAGLTNVDRIDLPATVTEIGREAFRGSGNPSAERRYYFAPAGVNVADGAFDNCRAVIRINGTELPRMTYTVGSNGVTITGMSEQPTEVIIPDTIDGKPVIAIGNNVFSGKRSLIRVVIPSTVTSLGQNAFYGCSSLAGIDLPEGLNSLGSGVFAFCSSLTEIDLPAGVTSLPSEAFYGCYALTDIDLSRITTLGKSVLRDCRALTEITIPEAVTSLPESAFEGDWGLLQVHLPGTLTTINNYAFYDCRSLTEVNIPAGLTAIPNGAFQKCAALQSIQLPAGLASIGQNAFRGCTVLTDINFPSGLTSIGQEAFRDACLNQTANAVYVLPDSVENFGSSAFYNCGAGLLVAKGSDWETFVKENGYTFAYNAGDGFRYQYKNNSNVYTLYLTGYKGTLSNVTIPAGPAVIGENAFKANIQITHITIPNGVTKIDRGAFEGCTNLTHVTMSNSVLSIEDRVFYSCANLTDIVFSNALTRIGSDAFEWTCTAEGVHYYNMPDNITEFGWTPFSSCGAVLCVTRDSSTEGLVRSNSYGENYTHYGETDFRYRYYDSEGSERLMKYAGSARTVEIPDYIWMIDDSAFLDNTTIQKVVIPEGVTQIRANAFRGCTNLVDITLPDSLTELYDNVFKDCGSAAAEDFTLELPSGFTVVGPGAFDSSRMILICDKESSTAGVISHRGYSFVRKDRENELDIRYKYNYFNNNEWLWSLYDYVGSASSVRLPDDCVHVSSDRLAAKVQNGLALVASQLSDTAEGISRAGMNFTFPGHGKIRYRIMDNKLYIMGSVGTGTTISIPKAAAYINAGWDEQVRGGAFSGNTTVTKVVIPEGVTRLNDDAFNGCTNLTDITLPDSLTSMGIKVFRYAGQNLAAPFYLTLPDGITDIWGHGGGANTFEGLNAVLVCGKASTTAATLSDGQYVYTCPGEYDYRYQYKTKPAGDASGRQVWLVGYVGEGAEAVIPSGIYGIWTSEYGNNTSSEEWPTIYGYGFRDNTTVTKVVIPEGTVIIQDSAFKGAVNLVDITFPESLKILRNHALEQCGKNADYTHYYVLPDDMTEIATNTAAGWGAFTDINKGVIVCSADSETARLVSNVYTNHYNGSYFFALKDHQEDGLIYRYERYNTDVQDVYDYRLSLWRYDGSASEVTIPADCGLYRIENNVFKDRSTLQKVVIPSGVVEIGSSAFDGCTLLHNGADENVIVIPNTVKRAGNLAFKNLGAGYAAERFYLVLPSSLTEFDINIFTGCNAVLVAPQGSAVASALFNNWYYYYNTLADAMAQTNVQYQHYYVDGKEAYHERYGRR